MMIDVQEPHDCALIWFRRDLRLTDNPALTAALATARRIVPVYILDPADGGAWTAGAASRSWLHRSLGALNHDLVDRGSGLVVRRGPALAALQQLSRECGATAVHWNRLYEPDARARDRRIEAALQADGMEIGSHNAALWAEPWAVRSASGGPYRVFTPFWRVLSTQLPDAHVTPAPERLPGARPLPPGEPLAELGLHPAPAWDRGFYPLWRQGESGALQRLATFVETGLAGYGAGRDRPDRDGVSRLSPHLHFGEIGPRQVLAAVQRSQATGTIPANDAAHYLRELGWREFAHHLLRHHPHTPDQPLDERFKRFAWRTPRNYAADLRAWQRGLTGIPIVDAGMRELWATGWMHNRVRMIVASFLTKNLLVPWQEGARWFWDTLVDADLANNTLGWQWVAGCGADAAPCFRIFNPLLQSQRFDPAGHYIRRWIPELRRLPDRALHSPWTAPAAPHDAAVRLGTDYPHPIVDLAASRHRAIDTWERLRGS